ncbi:MAG: hypothetical protein JW839_16960 [Candidatus Lokiarchaeota archaeon]|nr:hypothetical protein [Candidatus Lokiarchaeota archaeon]
MSMGLQAVIAPWITPAVPGEAPRPTSWWDNFKLILTGTPTPKPAGYAWGVANWVSQSLQESIVEGFISTTLERYGGPFFGDPMIADQLAEAISFALVDNAIEIGEAISSIPSAVSRASVRFQIERHYQREMAMEADMQRMDARVIRSTNPAVAETVLQLHAARVALVEARKAWSLDALAATLAAGGSIRDFRRASQVWPQVVDRIESRMVDFPNVDKQQDRLLSTLVNQVLKTKLLAKAIAYHDAGLTFGQFAAMADVKSACYLNPGATIEADAAYVDEHGLPRVATWDELASMDIATFLATRRGFTLVFKDSDPNARTTLGKGNWWTHDPDLHLWVPKKLVKEFDRLYPDRNVDCNGNPVTRWVCPACGASHSDYYHARAHTGGYVVDTINNKRLDPGQKATRIAELLEEGRDEVYYDKEWFATKLGVTQKNNPIIYDMIMHAEKLPASVFYAERKDIATRLKTSPEFRRLFGSVWLGGAYCEGQIVALYKSGTHAIPGGDAEWHFKVKGMKHFTTADGMAYKRTEIHDAQGNLVGWDYQAAIALEGKFRKFCDTDDFFKSFIHDLVATPRTTGLISGVALGVLRDTNVANYFEQLLSPTGYMRHDYWRSKIEVNGERWNMAFIEEGKKGSGIGTHVQYRLVPVPGSTALGHPDYDVKDGISAHYDVEYRISRPATPELAVPNGQPIPASLIERQGTCFYRFHRDALSHGQAMKVINGFIDGIIANPGATVQAPSLPSSAPLVKELDKLRLGTDKYAILEYIAKLTKLGYAITGHEINVAFGMTSESSSWFLDNFMNKIGVTQQMRDQLVKFPVSTRAMAVGKGLFWTLASIDGIPITSAQFDSMIAQHNALRQACLDLAQKLDVITRLGQMLGEIEWATNPNPKIGHPGTIRNKILYLQAAYAQSMFDYLMTVRPDWLNPNPTWHP